jgi:hypothetical protein
MGVLAGKRIEVGAGEFEALKTRNSRGSLAMFAAIGRTLPWDKKKRPLA